MKEERRFIATVTDEQMKRFVDLEIKNAAVKEMQRTLMGDAEDVIRMTRELWIELETEHELDTKSIKYAVDIDTKGLYEIERR